MLTFVHWMKNKVDMNNNPQIDKKTVLLSFFWKFMERGFAQGLSLFIQIVLARLLLPEDFGSMAILVAIIGYASVFVQSGLSTAIIQKKELEEKDIATGLTGSLGVALIMYLIIFCAAPLVADYYNSPELSMALRVQGLVLFFGAYNSVQIAIVSRRMQFRMLFWRSMLAIPISGAVGVGMALHGFGLWALIGQSLCSSFVTVAFMSWGADYRLRLGFSLDSAKEIYGFSVKLLLANLISQFHDMFRTMAVGRVFSKTDLAYFDKGFTYAKYANMLITESLSGVLLPVFSRKQDNPQEILQMARKSVQISSFVTFPLLLGIAALSKPLVVLLLTDKWLACVPFLALFCIFRLPGCISVIDKQIFYALGHSEIAFYYETGLLVVNMSTLLVALQFDVWTVAVVGTVVEIVTNIVIYIIADRIYGYTLSMRVKDAVPSLLLAGCLAFVINLVAGEIAMEEIYVLVGGGILLVLFYITISWLLRVPGWTYISQLVRKFG